MGYRKSSIPPYDISKKGVIGEAHNGRANGHQSGKQRCDVLLGSFLDPNCL